MNPSSMERRLLGCLLGLLLLAASADIASETAGQMRANAPWAAWLALRGARSDLSKPPAMYLLFYRWEDRVLHVIQMPENPASLHAYASAFGKSADWSAAAAAPAADRALAQFYGAELRSWIEPRLCLRWTAPLADPGSPEEVRSWILAWPRSLRFWLALPRAIRISRRSGNPKPGAYDAALLAREAFRLETRDLRLHALPAEPDRALFFSRLGRAGAPETPSRPTTVEILNASGESGIALQATKVLRWRGLDVVDFGNAASPARLTRFIDRTASYREAESVAQALGCGLPEISDAMDSSRRERVTVILGQDFRDCASLAKPAQTEDRRSETWN